jgi:hypothetical protein
VFTCSVLGGKNPNVSWKVIYLKQFYLFYYSIRNQLLKKISDNLNPNRHIINGNNLEVKNVQPDRSMLNAEYQLVCRLIFF